MELRKILIAGLASGLLLFAIADAKACNKSCDSSGSGKSNCSGSDASKQGESKLAETAKACLAKLKGSDPAEYERLMALKQSDPGAFKTEMKSLLKKSGAANSCKTGAKASVGPSESLKR